MTQRTPYDLVYSRYPSANGGAHIYLVDATGKKIAAIWGKDAEKENTAAFIKNACNAQDDLVALLTRIWVADHAAMDELRMNGLGDAADPSMTNTIKETLEKHGYDVSALAKATAGQS